ncbi:endonuclease domain-containing protein [Hymenobacter sp. J193]|uniref:endonuclease domain-containing protein n=1 Tax=Hymenobacter sp. J193 TaxID=2898429 RepID=UPI002151D981|nr:endonuclease domain-containing protein [Hymenobacter sp. J193]MCR5886570.1 endonuclease domain-containing protein [Hymenobacter sp. J193]
MPNTCHHNRQELKGSRRELRSNLTPAEATLWKSLQNGQLDGRKFRRQHSVGPYVLDFYCPAERLAIELDGQGHFDVVGQGRDETRTAYLSSLGIYVVRVENKLVFEQLAWVLQGIRQAFWDTRRL